MQTGSDTHKSSAVALIPTMVIALAVLLLALFVSGGRKGTIVVQRFVEPMSKTNGPQIRISIETVTETAPDGEVRRLLLTTSFGHARAYSESIEGDQLALYLPSDKTIYELTDAAYEAASKAYLLRRFPGQRVHVAPVPSYAGSWLAPGAHSFFAVQLRRGNYRLVGRTRIDGRPALKLTPTVPGGSIRFAMHSNAETILEPAYVTPRSYDPIEEESDGTVRYIWSEYRVLPATAATERLLSLTAAYSGARVSHSAAAYIRAAYRTPR